MDDSLTFSAVVDEAIKRSSRKDRAADIASYANSTIRECQDLGFFSRDMVEDALTANASPFIWTKPDNFRRLRAVRYGEDTWPKFIPPGRLQKEALQKVYVYYAADDYFVFKGVNTLDPVNVAYYTYAPRFKYYSDLTQRPARYEPETGWAYMTAITPDEQATARRLVANWLTIKYFDTVVEGTLAKLFKILGDDKRSTSAYALYKAFQAGILKSEVLDTLDVSGDVNG